MAKMRGMGDYDEGSFAEMAPSGLRSPAGAMASAGLPALPSIQFTREVPFNAWEAYAFIVGVAPLRLDDPRILRRNRRAVMIGNRSLAAWIWLGHSGSVAVNNGFPLAPSTSIALPLGGEAAVWVVAEAAGTVVGLAQLE